MIVNDYKISVLYIFVSKTNMCKFLKGILIDSGQLIMKIIIILYRT